MTYRFGSLSKQRLNGAHPLLQKLMLECIKHYDFMVLDSQRGKAAQEKAFREGNSKVHFGNSAHNWKPAIALDIAPYPLDWENTQRFIYLQFEVIKPIAKFLNIPIRQGLDWNRNGKITDERFRDFPHVELYPWRDWAKKDCKLIGA